ncbi:Uncharacterised protein [Mycobacteroides abscessus subsp. abscessus]|nr:Uncharacterised protein [Mycobacteroides abscessus subsp. abscessus]SKS90016.1 Uncharacterised protein [Mycobacteroides abscessus subsp. abscessus]SKU00550.1 Uncharacterised protein [Mycobacteroides abscessus subsp. abscessus]SKW82194.1 Uncharacterised protein [Mycobacteroides abscessus subsp. abscessus]
MPFSRAGRRFIAYAPASAPKYMPLRNRARNPGTPAKARFASAPNSTLVRGSTHGGVRWNSLSSPTFPTISGTN